MDLEPRKIKSRIDSKLNEYVRVLRIAEKPDWEEFSMSAKVTGAGIIIIGIIGFVFYLAQNVIPLYLLG